MTESNPLNQDLQDNLRFVRKAVEAKDQPPRSSNTVLIPWIMYTLICVPAYDYLPRYAGTLNLVGWIAAAGIGFVLGKRATRRTGQFDQVAINRTMLHWYGGIVLLLAAVYGLAFGRSGINEVGAGQVSVILVGFLYFTAGVHLAEARFMRWAGPVIVLSGIAIGWLPHLRWTAMGLIFTVCLMFPILFGGRKSPAAAV
jgi:hypothetical protein